MRIIRTQFWVRVLVGLLAGGGVVASSRAQDSTHWQRDMVLGPPESNNHQRREPSAQDVREAQADRIDDEGRAAMKNGDYESALAYFQQAYDESQLERYAKYYRRDIAWAKGAIAHQKGQRAGDAGDYQAALLAFEEAAKIDPDNKGYKLEIGWARAAIEITQGEAAYQSGDLATALAHYKNAQHFLPSSEKYRKLVAETTQEIGERARQKKQADAAVVNLQRSIERVANDLRPVNPKDDHASLDFVGPDTSAPPDPAIKGTAVASLPEFTDETPSDKKVVPGSAGYNIAKVHLATVAGVLPGTDTKAGDQLVAAGKIAETNGDLKPIYEGGATAAGSLPVPTMPPEDPTRFSTKVRNDARMIDALAGLNSATATRARLTTELADVTTRMQQAKTSQEMAELHQQLEQKNAEFNASLVAVTKAEEKVRKVHRTIDADVAPPVAAP